MSPMFLGLPSATDAKKKALEDLARALKKFAPDIAMNLVQRWADAKLDSEKAAEDFMVFLHNYVAGD